MPYLTIKQASEQSGRLVSSIYQFFNKYKPEAIIDLPLGFEVGGTFFETGEKIKVISKSDLRFLEENIRDKSKNSRAIP